MNKELQDLAWACLPKEARGNIKIAYAEPYVDGSYKDALSDIFGSHNLTSDTEPEEMLYCNKSKVQQAYKMGMWGNSGSSMLKYIFGDKCLPDKPLEEKAKEIVDTIKEDIENPIQMPETMLNPQPSIQVEPKFDIGDDVIFEGKPYKITGCQHFKGRITYSINIPNGEYKCLFKESDLEPYVEPETKENMEEEKELNLCELLKGCKGEKFYSLIFGEVTFVKVIEKPNLSIGEKSIVTNQGRYMPNAMYGLDGVPTLFPSRDLYEKYPLDAYAAWMEWKESKKQKRWRAKNGEMYWRIIFDESYINYITDSIDGRDTIDNANYKLGNYFHTRQEARQAIKIVKEALRNFHQKRHDASYIKP